MTRRSPWYRSPDDMDGQEFADYSNEWQAAWDKANAEYDALPWAVKVDRMARIIASVTTPTVFYDLLEERALDHDFADNPLFQ